MKEHSWQKACSKEGFLEEVVPELNVEDARIPKVQRMRGVHSWQKEQSE